MDYSLLDQPLLLGDYRGDKFTAELMCKPLPVVFVLHGDDADVLRLLLRFTLLRFTLCSKPFQPVGAGADFLLHSGVLPAAAGGGNGLRHGVDTLYLAVGLQGLEQGLV